MDQEGFKRFELHYGVILLLRTKKFLSAMDRVGRSKVSRPVGWILLYLMPISAAVAFYLFLNLLRALISSRGPQIAVGIVKLGPLVNLGIPGLNPYIPVLYGWIALFVGVIIHEGAHGVMARSFGLRVKNSGLILLFFVIPIGAFVDIEESALKQAPKSHSARVLAAGAGTNLVLAVLCLFLLIGVVGSMSPAVSGAGITGVSQGSPAYTSGVLPGDVVTAVNGRPITDLTTVLGPNTTLQAGQSLNLTVYRDGKIIQINDVKLVCCEKIVNTQTNQTLASYPYIGVNSISEGGLVSAVAAYTNPLGNPLVYIGCIPTLNLGNCQGVVPFSSSESVFYSSPLGPALIPVASVLYWIFFLNFNLAIFNSLPIFPFDGGQAFGVGVDALGRGRLSEATINKIVGLTTAGVLIFLFSVILGPYLYVYGLGL